MLMLEYQKFKKLPKDKIEPPKHLTKEEYKKGQELAEFFMLCGINFAAMDRKREQWMKKFIKFRRKNNKESGMSAVNWDRIQEAKRR